MNMIKNNPVTTADVELAEKIFGPDIATLNINNRIFKDTGLYTIVILSTSPHPTPLEHRCKGTHESSWVNVLFQYHFGDIATLKGKTIHQKPVPVVEDYIDIPQELVAAQHDITLCMDGMKVNGLSFLTTISSNIIYRTAQYVERPTTDAYSNCLKQVFRIYKLGGFKIQTIRSDNEFCPLMDPLANELGVNVNYANPQEHVPEAERNNRVLKERVRAAYHCLPFNRLPHLLVKTLVTESAKKLNFFPAKNGISPYYSPRIILHKHNLDYDKHCQIAPGTYVQAHNEPDPLNTNAPRILDGIYLRYNDNEQGGHDVLHLQTGRKITHRQVTPLPITPTVLKQVHRLAEMDDMPQGLKITNHTGQVLYDSTWIAGVDYDEDQFNDEDYDPASDDDDDSDDDDMDEMDPNEIGALTEPLALHQDNEDDDMSDDDEDLDAQEPEEEEQDSQEDQEDEDPNPTTAKEQPLQVTTRSGQISKPRNLLTMHQCHLQAQVHQQEEYSIETARVIAMTICHMNIKMESLLEEEKISHAQTYSLKKGLKTFGERGADAATGKMKQLHDRAVFHPIHVNDLTDEEKDRAMESLIFLVQKRDGYVKARTCANGSTQ
jgi:hypothetical protein